MTNHYSRTRGRGDSLASMNEQNQTRTLQLFYAGLMVDAAANFEHFGVVEQVREKKAREQAVAAPAQLAQLGIRSPRELFERFTGIFGCARWELAELEGGAVQAETPSCLACAIAKKRGGGKPCELYCINPFRGLARALDPARELEVEETLWEGGQRCLFRLS
jgi:hypothetical protein